MKIKIFLAPLALTVMIYRGLLASPIEIFIIGTLAILGTRWPFLCLMTLTALSLIYAGVMSCTIITLQRKLEKMSELKADELMEAIYRVAKEKGSQTFVTEDGRDVKIILTEDGEKVCLKE